MQRVILTFLTSIVLALGFSGIVCGAEPRLYKGQACLEIGNIKGEGPVTCEGEDGHCYGKGGCTFNSDDTIWILLRFRNVPPGKHTVTTNYGQGNFSNDTESWAHWFPIKANTTGGGSKVVKVNLDGRYVGKVNFCVDCPLE